MLNRISLAVALAATGAIPAHSQVTAEVPQARAALAADTNLIIYRRHAQPTVWAPTVKIDGRKVAAIGNKQYTAVRLAPGEHQVTLTWPLLSGQRGGGTSVDIADNGKAHYLEIVGISQFAGAGYAVTYSRMGSGIGEVDAEQGASTVAACCRFKAPN